VPKYPYVSSLESILIAAQMDSCLINVARRINCVKLDKTSLCGCDRNPRIVAKH
jgi:hypothetical protein